MEHGGERGRGTCQGISTVETFFKAIKSELIRSAAWRSRQQAETAVARCIDGLHIPVSDMHRAASSA